MATWKEIREAAKEQAKHELAQLHGYSDNGKSLGLRLDGKWVHTDTLQSQFAAAGFDPKHANYVEQKFYKNRSVFDSKKKYKRKSDLGVESKFAVFKPEVGEQLSFSPVVLKEIQEENEMFEALKSAHKAEAAEQKFNEEQAEFERQCLREYSDNGIRLGEEGTILGDLESQANAVGFDSKHMGSLSTRGHEFDGMFEDNDDREDGPPDR